MPDELVQISCEGCKRFFLTADGLAMLSAIKGPCPDCGGRFALDPVVRTDESLRETALD